MGFFSTRGDRSFRRHQLTAIIFTDIEGYTSLMGDSESEALDIIKKNKEIHLDAFERFSCIFHKQMGDGFLAVFSSLNNAIYASAYIIRETCKSDIRVRIGIHEGDVVFEDGDVFGDGVNIASRLEQCSKPGSIFASESVRNNLANKEGITSELIEEKTLKNVKEQVKIFDIKVEDQYIPEYIDESQNGEPYGRKVSWKIVLLIIAMFITVLGLWKYPFGANNAILLPGNSMALLPFENQGNNSEYDYLGSGIADGVITRLSRLNDISIISSSSSFKFKDSGRSNKEIADQLGVSMILEGGFLIIGNNVRITASLVGVEDSKVLLSESYSGQMDDIFSLQDKVSNGLLKHLDKSKVMGSSSPKNETRSMDAFKYYQEGINLLRKDYLYKSNIEESRVLFQKSWNIDPRYVEPSVAMAKSYLSEIFYGYENIYQVEDSLSKYVEIVSRIDAQNPDLLAIHGTIDFYKFDWESARLLFEKALELSPNNPMSYYYLSYTSFAKGNGIQDLKYMDKAIELDPLNNQYKLAKIIQLILVSELDAATEIVDQWLEDKPGDNMALFLKGVVLNQRGKYTEALDALLARSVGDTTNFMVAYSYGMVDNQEMSIKITNTIVERANRSFVSPVMIAIASLGVDDYDQSMDWLERAYLEKDAFILWILMDIFQPLHDDPRFLKLIKQVPFHPMITYIYPELR
jgi:class 3 adenylate cyclase/TolB-like protein